MVEIVTFQKGCEPEMNMADSSESELMTEPGSNEPSTPSVLREALEDMAWQFGYRGVVNGEPVISTGGLSALEDAFAALGWDDPRRVTAEPRDTSDEDARRSSPPDGGDGAPYRPVEERCVEPGCELPNDHHGNHCQFSTDGDSVIREWYRPSPPAQVPESESETALKVRLGLRNGPRPPRDERFREDGTPAIEAARDEVFEVAGFTGTRHTELRMALARLNSAYCDEIERVRVDERAAAELPLRNLLAVVHRDGGHRQAAFATLTEAGEDGERIVIEERVRADAAESRLAAAEAQVESLRAALAIAHPDRHPVLDSTTMLTSCPVCRILLAAPTVMADGEAESGGDTVAKYREVLNAILLATPGGAESRLVAPELFAQRNAVRALAVEALGELSADEQARWFTNRHTVIEAESEGEVKQRCRV